MATPGSVGRIRKLHLSLSTSLRPTRQRAPYVHRHDGHTNFNLKTRVPSALRVVKVTFLYLNVVDTAETQNPLHNLFTPTFCIQNSHRN